MIRVRVHFCNLGVRCSTRGLRILLAVAACLVLAGAALAQSPPPVPDYGALGTSVQGSLTTILNLCIVPAVTLMAIMMGPSIFKRIVHQFSH